ncbi:MAG: fumarylacetoacetate hydrolase family protein [Negativicutes bacterium]|nr:fumarylacetoacetate hydrolase family protein [Negativicutes bacterium]
MRLATIKLQGSEVAGIIAPAGVVPVASVNQRLGKDWPVDLFQIIQSEALSDMNAWFRAGGKEALDDLTAIPLHQVRFGPLYRRPGKIWGIGLNYVDHAGDLAEKAPTLAPASFAKFDTTIIGPSDPIQIPLQSDKTTAEAELGIIFGKKCKDVEEKDWSSVVAGFTTLIDMTAEDILRVNPRYLTRSKNFDTFFSFGPQLVTPDEIGDVLQLKVSTVINSSIHAQNVVANMTFPPAYLVSFHTKVATMLPGDIICTGTPRAVPIKHGDFAECRIDGFAPLANPVIDLKVGP